MGRRWTVVLESYMQKEKHHLLRKAFRIIRRNYGCPGNDGLSVSEIKKDYEKYEDTVWQSLENEVYQFEQKPKHIVIRDYLGKERDIFVYNVLDRWVQEFVKLQVEPVVEKTLAEYVYGFRRGKSDEESYKYILENDPSFILRVDIEDYFKSINKEKLFARLEKMGFENNVLNLLKKSLEHCSNGLPPGHVLSCMLSNFNLKDFDTAFPKNYTRYSDDMMFGVQTEEEAYKTLEFARRLLSEYDFNLNDKKTKITVSPTLEKIS